jgi:4-diphosphocytidyl-2-C-methyl-D-erythritol kinase
METIILNSCSKINLGLNVVRKREDGYHDIETIFYPVKLCDTLSFRKSRNFKFSSNNNILKNNTTNLIIRAKNKLEDLTGIKMDAEITLIKFIPLGGGLGGGSSNAANTLKGLCLLFNLQVPDDQLQKAALELGSDVPFFLNSNPCFASSRGEEMERVNINISNPILIVNPNIHVSTRWAFENVTPVRPKYSLKKIAEKDILLEEFKDHFNNDFEPVVFRTFPEIGRLKEFLYSNGAVFSSMSGSGSTVYGIFSKIEDALEAQNKLETKYLSFIHYEKF